MKSKIREERGKEGFEFAKGSKGSSGGRQVRKIRGKWRVIKERSRGSRDQLVTSYRLRSG